MSLLPVGASVANDDTVRASNASAYFYTLGDLLTGIDQQRVLDSTTVNDGLLGPTGSLGVDIGIGNNGEAYVRGTTINNGASSSAAVQSVASGRIQPMTLLLILGVAYLFLKR